MHEPQRFRPAAWEQLENRVLPSQAGGVLSTTEPVQRTDPYAVAEHVAYLQQAQQGGAAVAFLGDSIFDYWDDTGRGLSVWNQKIAPLNALDLGVAGDKTENLLWRVENGELSGQPKVVVLLIGANNVSEGDSPTAVADGIGADVAAIRAASPESQIVLVGLLPRNTYAADPAIPAVGAVNALLPGLTADPHVHFVNVDQLLLAPGGGFDPKFSLLFGLHPTIKGYEVMARELLGEIKTLLNPSNAPAPGTASVFPSVTTEQAQPTYVIVPLTGSTVTGLVDVVGAGGTASHKTDQQS